MNAKDFLARVDGHDYALLYRPEGGLKSIECYVGDSMTFESMSDALAATRGDDPVLLTIPYRQVRERGFEAIDDGALLRAMVARERFMLPLDTFEAESRYSSARLLEGSFDDTEESYADAVRTILRDEIGQGAGSNFVLKRSYHTRLENFDDKTLIGVFARLLRLERGTYWTFLIKSGDSHLVGASPELHIGLEDGVCTMNPISGTYRLPIGTDDSSGTTLLEFLDDVKESEELYMVLDEELKMMTGLCSGKISVIGPRLKRMSKLVHTEYLIQGETQRDVEDVLLGSMFAPTVTGSPIENACRVIAKHESVGRGYYAGAVALIEQTQNGPKLDSSITIRSAQVDQRGREADVRIDVGSTLVRHSVPERESAETVTKVSGILSAFSAPEIHIGGARVVDALRRRGEEVNSYWFDSAGVPKQKRFLGKRVVLVDAEDGFANMLAHQLTSLGLVVERRSPGGELVFDDCDLVLFGPGPGDPNGEDDYRNRALTAGILLALSERKPFIAVCLSHQILCRILGLPLIRLPQPNQGRARLVDFFGEAVRVGFYNSYAAVSDGQSAVLLSSDLDVAVNSGGEVDAIRGPGFMSFQFHPESVLSVDGLKVIQRSLGWVFV